MTKAPLKEGVTKEIRRRLSCVHLQSAKQKELLSSVREDGGERRLIEWKRVVMKSISEQRRGVSLVPLSRGWIASWGISISVRGRGRRGCLATDIRLLRKGRQRR